MRFLHPENYCCVTLRFVDFFFPEYTKYQTLSFCKLVKKAKIKPSPRDCAGSRNTPVQSFNVIGSNRSSIKVFLHNDEQMVCHFMVRKLKNAPSLTGNYTPPMHNLLSRKQPSHAPLREVNEPISLQMLQQLKVETLTDMCYHTHLGRVQESERGKGKKKKMKD